jgi:hypothetical protein
MINHSNKESSQMADVSRDKVEEIYQHFKNKKTWVYDEEKYCKMLINTMLDKNKGTVSSFCVEAMIADVTFYAWVREHELFGNLYYFTRQIARELWEEEGRRIRSDSFPIGTIDYSFEYWKLIGWSRFGVSKNSKLKINLTPHANPAQHYNEILKQAAEGDFTSAEFKQVMEAINVGLNVHQVFELQKQIDDLKSDLSTLAVNKDVQNPFTNKGIAQKD